LLLYKGKKRRVPIAHREENIYSNPQLNDTKTVSVIKKILDKTIERQTTIENI